MDQPANTSWKPRFSLLGFISGGLWGLGGIVLMQQAGRYAMSAGQLSKALLSALLLGVVVPTAIRWMILNRPRGATVPSAGLALVLALGLAALVSPRPATAQGCSLVVNGQNVSAGTVVSVGETDDLSVGFTGQDVTGGNATVKYGPIKVYSDSFTLDAPKSGTEVRSVERSRIADRGVGLYEITATVNTAAADCDFNFFIDVEGDPLGSPAGKGAAALLGVGVLGSVVAIGKEIASALAQIKGSL